MAQPVAVPNVGHGADPTRTCAKKKLGATGKKVSDKLKCHATAAGKAVGVDVACLAKAEGTFTSVPEILGFLTVAPGV